jgi:hypothetical protein
LISTAGYFEKSLFGKSRGILKIPHFPSISLVSLEKRPNLMRDLRDCKGNRKPAGFEFFRDIPQIPHRQKMKSLVIPFRKKKKSLVSLKSLMCKK